MCYEDYILQEIIDGEYTGNSDEVMNHIKRCDNCKKRYNALKEQEVYVANTLDLGLDLGKSIPNITMLQPQQPKRRKIMNKLTKRLVSAAAAVAIIASVIFIEPVNAKAAELLQLFRINELNTVSITEKDIQEITRVLENGSGEIEIEDFMKVTSTEFEGQQSDYDLTDNTFTNDFPDMLILPPTDNGKYDYYDYMPGGNIELTIHVDKANDFLNYIGEDTQLPDALDQKPFSIHIGKTLNYRIRYTNELTTHVMQMEFPEIEIPDAVNKQELLNILFSLNLLPTDIKEQLQNMNNLTSTAPIPVLADEQTVEEITLLGNKAIVVRNTDSSDAYSLYFTYNNKLVTINTSDSLEHIIQLIEETHK